MWQFDAKVQAAVCARVVSRAAAMRCNQNGSPAAAAAEDITQRFFFCFPLSHLESDKNTDFVTHDKGGGQDKTPK